MLATIPSKEWYDKELGTEQQAIQRALTGADGKPKLNLKDLFNAFKGKK